MKRERAAQQAVAAGGRALSLAATCTPSPVVNTTGSVFSTSLVRPQLNGASFPNGATSGGTPGLPRGVQLESENPRESSEVLVGG